jgi:two-component system sensor histidine kinase MprB
VHDAVRAIRPLADLRRVHVELRGIAEAPVRGDADLLGRLVLNLLDNAVKYSPAGGTVAVDLAFADGAWSASVRDEGPGIPADAHERVFERFFRVDTARSRIEQSVSSGAGLGLAIARRIAEAHGGALVLAASVPGRTVFRATIPGDVAAGAP